MNYSNFIGIDISKTVLDIALLTMEGEIISVQWSNDRTSLLKEFEQFFTEYNLKKENTLICAEHTGHFGNKLLDVALSLDLDFWLESPYDIRHSQGLIRGKNDRVDAVRIAEYARRFVDKVRLIKSNSKAINQIKHLHTERSLLLQDMAKYKAQLKQEDGFLDLDYFKDKKKRILRLTSCLQKAIKQVENKIDEIIKNDEEIQASFTKIVSVEGVGKQTAIATIVATDNFRKFENPKKFACHVGCAPFSYNSGSSIRSRNKVSHKANKNLKTLYHMAALSILSTKGELRQYYDRKIDEGKNKMSVLNAIRSKIIHRIFAVIRDNRKYEKNYTHILA